MDDQRRPSSEADQREALERLAEASGRLWGAMWRRAASADAFIFPDPWTATQSLVRAYGQLAADPEAFSERALAWTADYLRLWEHTAARLLGEEGEPPAAPERGDRRFDDPEWTGNPWLDHLRQAHLLGERHLQAAIDAAPGLDDHARLQARFYARQLGEATAPSNLPALNPKAFSRTLACGGTNLLRGAAHLADDLARGDGQIRPVQADLEAFELGRDIAATPGEVVYENHLMQVLQYTPTTDKVDRRPLLIVPPWINKYYVLDLLPKRSFIRWAVEQGLTVFVISWVNPDASYAGTTFDDYVRHGPLTALEVVEEATGEREANALGYCIGGTLLACTLAWLTARGEAERCRSATFLTTLLEFSDVGELEVFIDEPQIARLEAHMARRGFLDGHHLGNAFNLLQARELIWTVGVHRYLLAEPPPAFDLLYWNSDATRMPAAMHSFYLRNMYLEDRLKEPGAIELLGEPIDLGRIKTPAYCLATRKDHIAPWTGAFKSARHLGGPVRFVLGGSGHIAGAINPPHQQKYGYAARNGVDADHERWLAAAREHEGSWWPDWRRWLSRRSGGQVAAREPGGGRLTPIEPAPGRYVRKRIDSRG